MIKMMMTKPTWKIHHTLILNVPSPDLNCNLAYAVVKFIISMTMRMTSLFFPQDASSSPKPGDQ